MSDKDAHWNIRRWDVEVRGEIFVGMGCSTPPMIKHDNFVGHFSDCSYIGRAIHGAGIQDAPPSTLNFSPAVIPIDFWTWHNLLSLTGHAMLSGSYTSLNGEFLVSHMVEIYWTVFLLAWHRRFWPILFNLSLFASSVFPNLGEFSLGGIKNFSDELETTIINCKRY